VYERPVAAEAVPDLLREADRRDPYGRLFVYETLVRVGGDAVLEGLLEDLRSKDIAARAVAARAPGADESRCRERSWTKR
jgi:hypothetical protein